MRKNLAKILAILVCFTIMASVNVFAAMPISTNQSGIDDGYYYNFWTDGRGSVTMNLGSGGNYSVIWSNCGNFICGKGWYPGAARTINYSSSFNVSGNALFSVYGWTTNPLVEYYVVENYGSWTPPGGSPAGVITTDGGTYYLYRTQAINQLSVIGTATFYRYWSVRASRRSSGTVTLRNHFNAWVSKGWNMGTFHYQLVAVEGIQGSGSANVTFSEGPIIGTPTPSATPVPTAAPSPTARVSNNYVVSYVVQSNWGTGGNVSVTIKNNTSTTVNGWTFVFTLPSGTTISNLWNGTYTQSGTTVTVKNTSGNGTIGAGGSVNFGFNFNGSSGAGSGFTLNGTACAIQ